MRRLFGVMVLCSLAGSLTAETADIKTMYLQRQYADIINEFSKNPLIAETEEMSVERVAEYFYIACSFAILGQHENAAPYFDILAARNALTRYSIINAINNAINTGDLNKALNRVFMIKATQPSNIFAIKTNIFNLAVSKVKEKFMAEKRTFVGTAGKAAMEQELQPLADALNAPMFDGIESALRRIDIIVELDRSAFVAHAEKIWAEVNSAKSDPALANTSGLLQLYLGVEQWNKFVKDYNGPSE